MSASAGAEMIGNAATLSHLRSQMDRGVLPHAVLLWGPEGVGKTTIALRAAERLLGAGSWPGGVRAHPDVWIEDSDEDRISIRRIRSGGGESASDPSLQDFLSLRPYAAGARVAVLARADRLTEDAANCLLKTVEEPPPGTHILLCSAVPDQLPQTIRSRCQLLGCAPVAEAEISEWLQRGGAPPAIATMAARLSGGRPGRASRLAADPGNLAAELDALDALVAAAGMGVSGALELAGRLVPSGTAESRERAVRVIATWSGFLRDVAATLAGAPELVVWSEYAAVVAAWAAALNQRRVTAMLTACIEASDGLSRNAQPRLTLETLTVDLLAREPAPPAASPPVRVPELQGVAAATVPERPKRGGVSRRRGGGSR